MKFYLCLLYVPLGCGVIMDMSQNNAAGKVSWYGPDSQVLFLGRVWLLLFTIFPRIPLEHTEFSMTTVFEVLSQKI
jgi:hypothetical protein